MDTTTAPIALNPDTPQAWLVARLREDAALLSLLDGPHIYESGDVPLGEDGQTPGVYVVIVPPVVIRSRRCGELFVQSQSGRFLVAAETQSDRVPDMSATLTPIHLELQRILAGVSNPEAPTGGAVWSCEIGDFHTPRPLRLSEGVRLGQKGVYVTLQAT